LITTPLYRY